MEIKGSVALVTGANRGIGRAFVEALEQAGAARIYATARNADTLDGLASRDGGRIVPLALDVTSEEQVRTAAERAGDVGLLVNNAGVLCTGSLLDADAPARARTEMRTNYFGTLLMSRAFAPILAKNGGGAIVNLNSVASHVNFPLAPTYSVSKAAGHSLTQALRAELEGQGTKVVGVYPGPIDTDMAAEIDLPKTPAVEVARAALEAVERGFEDVFPDPFAARFRDDLARDAKALEKRIGAMVQAG